MKPDFPGKYKPYRLKWVFIILPLFYLFLSMVYLSGINQFYINHYDPTYPYLLNGVNLASGHFRVGNIEHPGTPVDIFAAVIIFIKHLFSGSGSISQDVLLHPESYLFTIGIVLAFLISLVTYLGGRYVFRYSGNAGLALLFQSPPLLYRDMIGMAVSLSTESFITICGISFMTYLYINTILKDNSTKGEKSNRTTDKNIIIFGLFTALLFTTKIYCAPVILVVLIIVKEWKQKLIYLISTGIFTVLLLFPLYNQLRNWAGWVKTMVFHSGAYGHGSSGIIDITLYRSNIIELFATHYIFSFIYLILVIAFIVGTWVMARKNKSPGANPTHAIAGEKELPVNLIYAVTGMVVFFTIFILIIVKQYKVDCPNPLTGGVITITKFYYFILIITFFPFAIANSYKMLISLISLGVFQSNKQKIFIWALLIFIVWGGVQSCKACYEVRNKNVEYLKTRQFIDTWKQTPLIMVTDGGDQVYPEPGLFVGIIYAGKWDMPQYFDSMKKAYPESYIYAIGWKDALTFWGSETDISSILDNYKKVLVYISGADSISEEVTLKRICRGTKPEKGAIFKKIFSTINKYESIYLVKTDTL